MERTVPMGCLVVMACWIWSVKMVVFGVQDFLQGSKRVEWLGQWFRLEWFYGSAICSASRQVMENCHAGVGGIRKELFDFYI